jgi:CubicO group peptidase (beta-lactamase class C family)
VPWPTDHWPRAELDGRVDRDLLDGALDHAFAQPESLGTTNAVLIVQRGAIVAERYADGLDATTTHVSWSMAKSMLHAAIGILVREGRIDVAAVADHPAWRAKGDPRESITIDQLLKMRSGLLFNEDYVDASTSHVIEMLFGAGKPDAAAYAAALPLEHEPGSVFSYSSGTSNILSAVVARALGARGDAYREFLRRELWGPLGMKSADPRFDEAGHWIASSFVFATAQDFARFGLLYLRDGVWAGRRILPEGWVDYARTHTGTEEETGFGYGAHWWLVPGSLGIFRCSGYNGQRIIVVPPLDLVVVRLGVSPVEIAPELERFSKRAIDAFRPLLDRS